MSKTHPCPGRVRPGAHDGLAATGRLARRPGLDGAGAHGGPPIPARALPHAVLDVAGATLDDSAGTSSADGSSRPRREGGQASRRGCPARAREGREARRRAPAQASPRLEHPTGRHGPARRHASPGGCPAPRADGPAHSGGNTRSRCRPHPGTTAHPGRPASQGCRARARRKTPGARSPHTLVGPASPAGCHRATRPRPRSDGYARSGPRGGIHPLAGCAGNSGSSGRKPGAETRHEAGGKARAQARRQTRREARREETRHEGAQAVLEGRPPGRVRLTVLPPPRYPSGGSTAAPNPSTILG
jgi:hypothetical protein